MIDQAIVLLINVLIFAVAAYALYWVCERFKLPTPAYWICGVLLIVIILLFLAGRLGGGPLMVRHG